MGAVGVGGGAGRGGAGRRIDRISHTTSNQLISGGSTCESDGISRLER